MTTKWFGIAVHYVSVTRVAMETHQGYLVVVGQLLMPHVQTFDVLVFHGRECVEQRLESDGGKGGPTLCRDNSR